MDNSFYYAGCISVIFFILKAVETKILHKKQVDFKYLLRETVLICFCSIVGIYGCNNYAGISNLSNTIKKAAELISEGML